MIGDGKNDHDHDHLHQYDPGHQHPVQDDHDDTMTYYRVMEEAVRDLLIEKNFITAEQIRDQIEKMDARVVNQMRYGCNEVTRSCRARQGAPKV